MDKNIQKFNKCLDDINKADKIIKEQMLLLQSKKEEMLELAKPILNEIPRIRRGLVDICHIIELGEGLTVKDKEVIFNKQQDLLEQRRVVKNCLRRLKYNQDESTDVFNCGELGIEGIINNSKLYIDLSTTINKLLQVNRIKVPILGERVYSIRHDDLWMYQEIKNFDKKCPNFKPKESI